MGIGRRLRDAVSTEPLPRFEGGWGGFPPLPDGTSADEVQSYLDRCSFGSAVVDSDRRLVVTLVDPRGDLWTFEFGRATFSVADWPDSAVEADWEPGIYDLDSSTSSAGERPSTTYVLESKVSLIIVAEAVEVRPPGQHR